jgi:hypothetical protein
MKYITDHNTKVSVTRKPRHRIETLIRACHITNTSIATVKKSLEEKGYFDTKLYRVSQINDTFDSFDHPDHKGGK